MDGEAGWWTTNGNIGLPPLARVMGVGRQQQHKKAAFQMIGVHVYKGKGDQLVCGSYRAIKLLEQPMKVLESVGKEDRLSGVN